MKLLLRNDDRRLQALTLYKAHLVLLLLGLAYSVYEFLTQTADPDSPTDLLFFFSLGINLIGLLATGLLISGLRASRYRLMNIGYLLSTLSTAIIFTVVHLIQSQMASSADNIQPKAPLIALVLSLVVLFLSYACILFLSAGQTNAPDGISDRDKKKWFLPCLFRMLSWILYFGWFFAEYSQISYLRPTVIVVAIIFTITLSLAMLLEMVALCCSMHWIACPVAIDDETPENIPVEGGIEE